MRKLLNTVWMQCRLLWDISSLVEVADTWSIWGVDLAELKGSVSSTLLGMRLCGELVAPLAWDFLLSSAIWPNRYFMIPWTISNNIEFLLLNLIIKTANIILKLLINNLQLVHLLPSILYLGLVPANLCGLSLELFFVFSFHLLFSCLVYFDFLPEHLRFTSDLFNFLWKFLNFCLVA